MIFRIKNKTEKVLNKRNYQNYYNIKIYSKEPNNYHIKKIINNLDY